MPWGCFRHEALAVFPLCVLLAGCAVMPTGGPGDGAVEQFAFEARPGNGPGADADALVAGYGQSPENADHIATIPTPPGDPFVGEFTDQGGLCRGMVIDDPSAAWGVPLPEVT